MRLPFALSLLLLPVGCAAPVPPAAAPAEVVTYRSGKETVRAFLHRPPGAGPFPALVVLHGDRGLTDGVKREAGRLAGLGYVTLAVDLYRGQVAGDLLDAHIMDRALPDEQVHGDLRAAVDYLVSRPDVRPAAVGVLGWDSGGGYALDGALKDSRLRAVVTCYGRLATDPVLLAPLHASVLGIFAEKDEGISGQTIEQFRAAMRKAGKRVAGLHVYDGCEHGFLNPSDKPQLTPAARDAWDKIEQFLAAELQR